MATNAGCASAQKPPPRVNDGLDPPSTGYEPVHVPDVPLPAPADHAGPVSLDSILAYADHHAPALRVARERLGLGDAAVAGAEPPLPDNPVLSLGAGPRDGADGTHVDFTASLSQRFEIAGERGLRLDAAERTRLRFRAELDEARWDVHQQVHAAFHRALVGRERAQAAQRVLTFQERLLEIAHGRLQAGDVSPLAVRLADGELSQARVGRIAAEQAYLRARLELGTLAGWPASNPPEPAGELDSPRDPPDASSLLAAARAHQPRLRTLQAARTEALAKARAADRDAWVEPTIGVEVTREGARSGLEETVILGTVSVPLPLVQRNQAERAAARAQTRVAAAQQEAFGSELLNRLVQHRAAVVAAAARVRTYGSEIVPTFEESLRLVQRAFELGEIDILQVSVARERFLRIQADALDAYEDYFQSVADLEAATGTDLWADERHEHDATRGEGR